MPPPASGLDPRLRVVYLVGVAVGVFLVRPLEVLAGVLLAHAALWLAVGLGTRRLLRQVVKLWLFALFIVGSYAFFANDPATDRWHEVHLFGVGLSFNVAGAREGVAMVLRILTVILASQIARAGDPRSIAQGLDRLRVPAIVGMSIDAVLSLLGEGGGGRGRGDGRGRHRARGEQPPFWASVKRLACGDVEPILERLEGHIGRAEQHAEATGSAQSAAVRRDVGVIAGVALTMLAIKVLKVLPSLPIAPGHKLVLLTPLYVLAALMTKNRAGATLTGLTMGTVAFLLGDGRYGIFEIFKHIAPGVMCDLLVPWLMRAGRRPGALAWTAFGAVVGVGRFATVFLVTLTALPPAMAYPLLVPGLLLNVFFSAMSGYVSYHLVAASERLRARRQSAAHQSPAPPGGQEPMPPASEHPEATDIAVSSAGAGNAPPAAAPSRRQAGRGGGGGGGTGGGRGTGAGRNRQRPTEA